MSLLQIQNQNRQNAMTGYRQLGQLEQNRKSFNKQASAQNRAKVGSAVSSGIAMGMMTGNPMVGVGVALMGALF